MLAKIYGALVEELEDYTIPGTSPPIKPKLKDINGFGLRVGERAKIEINEAKTSFFLIMHALLLPGSWLQMILSRDKKEPCLLFFYFLDEQYFDSLDPVTIRTIAEKFTSWRWRPDTHLGQATQIWKALLDEHCKASQLTFDAAEQWEAWQIMLDLAKQPNSELEDTIELLENRKRLEHKGKMNEVIFARFQLLVQRKVERLRSQGRLPRVDPNVQIETRPRFAYPLELKRTTCAREQHMPCPSRDTTNIPTWAVLLLSRINPSPTRNRSMLLLRHLEPSPSHPRRLQPRHERRRHLHLRRRLGISPPTPNQTTSAGTTGTPWTPTLATRFAEDAGGLSGKTAKR